MPLFELTHPPPSRPAVESERVKDLELVVFIFTIDPKGEKPPGDLYGPDIGPIISRWIAV